MSLYSIADPAYTDLDDIWNYIAQDSEEAAERMLDKLYDMFVRLSGMPGMGRRREELAPNLRSFPVGSYIVYYRPIEGGIEIVRILHGSRDLSVIFPS